MTNEQADRIKGLVERLRSPLPVCPYDRRSPDYYTAPDDKPCVVCGQENDDDAPDVCRGADTRCMIEAAEALQALQTRAEDAERENERLSARNLEVSTLAHGWMVAHDNRAAGLPVTYPSPADVPASLFLLALVAAAATGRGKAADKRLDFLASQLEAAETRVGELEGALKPFMPISIRMTPDYAEVEFGEHQTQAMTMDPHSWVGLNDAYAASLTHPVEPGQ